MRSAELKPFVHFGGNVVLAHFVTTMVVSTITYPTLTKQFYEGPNAVFATFLRTHAQPDLFRHAANWFVPGNLLCGVLIALVLYPFLATFRVWPFRKRFLTISGLYLVLGFWAASAAAPGTITGFVFLRPEITPYAHLMVQPEIVFQGLLFGVWVAAASSPITEKRSPAAEYNIGRGGP